MTVYTPGLGEGSGEGQVWKRPGRKPATGCGLQRVRILVENWDLRRAGLEKGVRVRRAAEARCLEHEKKIAFKFSCTKKGAPPPREKDKRSIHGLRSPLGRCLQPSPAPTVLHTQLPGPDTASLPTPSSSGTRPGHAPEMLWDQPAHEDRSGSLALGRSFSPSGVGLLGLQVAPHRWGALFTVGERRYSAGSPRPLQMPPHTDREHREAAGISRPHS